MITKQQVFFFFLGLQNKVKNSGGIEVISELLSAIIWAGDC